ncbi:uncharacterized protein LODBEIA_P22410 [Lodderomyces beijingensis]|uniref:Phosphatidate phosphatase APP1 catalytic domain-containing protein n=1 Tax=Lodderomyces beijingensis TaxID=1775926 RepID=A0ABP0ZKW0_9ASCO
MSRRQRLLGLAKTTRDNYIPKITTSVSSLAAGASRAFTNPGEICDDDGRVVLPKDTSIQLFPTYTRQRNNKYYVDVAGWVSAPGSLNNRRNRMILTVIRKSMRQKDGQFANQEIERLEHDSSLNQEVFNPNSPSASDADAESIGSSESDQSSFVSIEGSPNSEDKMKERIAAFFAKSIPNTQLRISVGSESSVARINDAYIFTDETGHFATTIEVDYKPSVVSASSTMAETVFAFQDVMIYPSTGLGVISDIDDTVKITGVTGDKRLMLRNLLVEDFETWNIPPIVNWYASLYKRKDVNFFYVSNSPWQLFNSINLYFKLVGLPSGSIHLKKWVGNIISSLLEPSQSRKKRALNRILEDFPEKKFICIGDSGEQDLEAYVDLARAFPNQVLSINIRYVENSFSDDDDQRIYKELMRLIAKKRMAATMASNATSNTNTDNTDNNTTTAVANNAPVAIAPDLETNSAEPEREIMQNLIDLDGPAVKPKRKAPPMVPKKPMSLRSPSLDGKLGSPTPSLVSDLANSVEIPNGSRPSSSNIASDGHWMEGENLPPLPPRRPRSSMMRPRMEQSYEDELDEICNSPGFMDLEETDKKGAQWIRRIIIAIHALKNTNTKINIFMDTDAEFFSDSSAHIEEILRVN